MGALNQLLTGKTAAPSDEWYTPLELIRSLGEFDLDPACGPLCQNKTAAVKFDRDGLEREWFGRVWMNPPFSSASVWVNKFIKHGNGIALVFGRTDAKWFHDAVAAAGCFFAFMGRTKFNRPGEKPASNCPLGCVLIPMGQANIDAIVNAKLKGMLLTTAQ